MHMPSESVLCSGMVDRIGLENGNLNYVKEGYEVNERLQVSSHRKGLERVIEMLLDPVNGAIGDVNEIDAVGHRVVHGGTAFSETTVITREVKDKIAAFESVGTIAQST